VLWVQLDPFDAAWVRCGPDENISSCTGLAQNSEHFFAVEHRDQTASIRIISKKNFSVVDSFLLPEVKDAHSLVWHGQRLFIVSTGSDSVFSFDPYRKTKSLKRVWQAGASETDIHHLNGLCVVDGQVLCCGFGPKSGDTWKTAEQGFIRNLSTGKFLLQGLRQPHSLFADESKLFLCESALGTVRTLQGSVRNFDAYTRGLACLPGGKLIVGISSRRKQSKSTGQNNPEVQESSRGKCGLALFSNGGATGSKFYDLSAFGDEIYDVAPLTAAPAPRIIRQWRICETDHQRRLERSITDARSWGQQLDGALSRARAAHAAQVTLVAERTAWARQLDAQLKGAREENQLLRARLNGESVPIKAEVTPPPAVATTREILLHFHIFKNAGTTLDAALQKNLGPAWLQLEGDDPNDRMDWKTALKHITAHAEARAVSSHTLRYPPPAVSGDIKFIPLILLRHPIDRLVSIYLFERANLDTGHHETSRIARTGSLADFVGFTLKRRPELGCDTQTAFVARAGWYRSAPTKRNLATAKAAIRTLHVPGIVEKLDQYFALLELEFGKILPEVDLAQPDENRNPERAPTLLARLRQIRAQLPPKLWRKLCERNRLDLELWRFTRRLALTRFNQTPGAAERLKDFRERKKRVTEAVRQSLERMQQTRELAKEEPLASPKGNNAGLHRAYQQMKETASERLAWAQSLGKELQLAQANFVKLNREHAERTAWAKSLDAELSQARAAFAEQAKLVEERTRWAKSLDAELQKGRAALAAQSKLVEERSAWGKALTAELHEAQANFAKLTKEHGERTAWAKRLEADLEKSREALAEQTKLVGERSTWGKALEQELHASQKHFTRLTKEYHERTAWAKNLEAELQQVRAGVTAQTKLVEERSIWGKALEQDLATARSQIATLTKEHAERTKWATTLNADLSQARAGFAAQTKLVEERTAWAQTLDADLAKARNALGEQVKLTAERSAWGKALDAELNEARANLAAQSKLVEERTAWAKSLDAELDKARALLAEQVKLTENRSVWGKALEQELATSRGQFAALAKEHDERAIWAKKLDADLNRARAELAAQTKLVEERTVWAKTLDAELEKARVTLAEQMKLTVERSAWAKSLDAELNQTRDALAAQVKLTGERAAEATAFEKELKTAQAQLTTLTEERVALKAWSESLESDLKKIRAEFAEQSKRTEERTAWGQALDTELQAIRVSLAKEAKLVEERTEWAKSLEADLGQARSEIATREVHTQRLAQELALLRIETKKAEGTALEYQSRAEVAESEVRRLTETVSVAHVHVEHLFEVVRRLQQQVNVAAEEKTAAASLSRQQIESLRSITATLELTQRKLAQYEKRLLCRVAMRMTSPRRRPISRS
jgi:hypothetical protein